MCTMGTPQGASPASTMTHSVFFGPDSSNSVPLKVQRGANLYDFIADAIKCLREQIRVGLSNLSERRFKDLVEKPVRDLSAEKPVRCAACCLAG